MWTVSPGFFDMLGVRAAIGRTFRSDDEEPGRDQVVVLTDGFWQRHFGGDPAIVGQSVLVDGRSVTHLFFRSPINRLNRKAFSGRCRSIP